MNLLIACFKQFKGQGHKRPIGDKYLFASLQQPAIDFSPLFVFKNLRLVARTNDVYLSVRLSVTRRCCVKTI